MYFIDKLDIGGCQSGEVYFDRIRNIFSGYESIWDNLQYVRTDGCSVTMLTSCYVGDTAQFHRTYES